MDETKDSIANAQILLAWKAPMRAYKKSSSGVLRFYVALSLLLALLVWLLGDKILIFPIGATLFIFYVLTITPPVDVSYKITRFGVETGGNTFRFEHLSYFFYFKKFDYFMLVLVSGAPYFTHAYLVVPDKEILTKAVHILSEHIVYKEKPERNLTDTILDWISRIMPNDQQVESPKEETPTVPLPEKA
ncbi:MAG: hypothetical protein ACMG6E_00755 [Candidatus Roizmanbacteria bacterium]